MKAATTLGMGHAAADGAQGPGAADAAGVPTEAASVSGPRAGVAAVRAPSAVMLATLLLASAGAAWGATPPPFTAAHAAVASDNVQASESGVAVLRAGGNAADAACATALALGVVHPFASGIGGGGFALVFVAKEQKVYALDFRERAPAALRAEMFLRDGKADPLLSREGGLAVGVPGEVRGLGELVKRFGRRSFGTCVGPALKLARGAARVSWRLAEVTQPEEVPTTVVGGPTAAGAALDPKAAAAARAALAHAAEAKRNAEAKAKMKLGVVERLFGGPLKEGAPFKRMDLAATLARLAAAGPDAFYRGPIAQAIVTAVHDAGGVMTADDLAKYAPTERQPLQIDYRGLRIAAMPPPSSGGVALAETLGILAARFPNDADLMKLGWGSSAHLHVLAEAMKHAFADRARHLGDPDFVKLPMEHLMSAAYHAELARRIKDNGVLPEAQYGTPGPTADPAHDHGTAHLCVIDAEGNAVALTTTVNLGFGSGVVAGKTGIVLNDQMDDFSVQPGVPNGFGLIGSAQNAVAPGKRPLSSMTPTLVLEPEPAGATTPAPASPRLRVRMAVGAAGGPTIISSTLQVLLNVVDWKMDAQAAIAAPRIHDQWMPPVLMVEPQVPRDVQDGLKARGQNPRVIPHIGTANAIVRVGDHLEAAAEPRSPSVPAGY